MIPNSIVYPDNFVNRRGIPLLESSNITSDATNVIITIANRAFRFLDDRGVFLFRLNLPIPEGSDTLPVIFSWTGFTLTFTLPLTTLSGTNATGALIADTGVYLIYYDKTSNLLQLMTTT